MKVVFDTNVFVSAFIVQGSQGETALLLAQRRKVFLYSSVPILTETARILRSKFDQLEDDIRAALRIISRAATLLQPARNIAVLEDLPDNRILGCAVTAHANLVVTGDHHLLRLREFEDIPMVRLADFLRMIPAE